MRRWLFFSNWLRGDIVQYDLSDPANPKFAARIFVGGVARKGDEHQVCDDPAAARHDQNPILGVCVCVLPGG